MPSVAVIALCLFGLLFLTSTGVSACPANAVVGVSQCLQTIGSMQGGSVTRDELCNKAPASISCAQRIIDACPDDPQINELLAALNWNAFTSMIQSACTGGPVPMGPANGADTNCPSNYREEIMECKQQMDNVGSNPSCSEAKSALDCLRGIMEDCANKPEVRMISRLINMTNLQDMVSQSCSVAPVEPMTIAPEVIDSVEESPATEATEPEESIESATDEPTETEESQSGGSCSIPNPKRLFRKCKQRIVSSRVGQGDKAFGCRRVLSGLNCIIRLKRTCPKMKILREYSTIERLQHLRDSVATDCNEVL